VERCPVPALSRSAVETVLRGFVGEQQQIPPMYSALKHDGERLYRLARRGVTLPLHPRRIVIAELELLEIAEAQLELRVLCSKGTYVRVLAEDIARALGSCGRLYRLRRDYVEPFEHERMYSLEELEACTREARSWPLLPVDAALQHLPLLRLAGASISALAHGQPLPGLISGEAALWRLYDAHQRFLGLGQSDAEGTLRARRLFGAAMQADG